LGVLAGYVVVGIVWSFVKWGLYVRKEAERHANDFNRDRARNEENERNHMNAEAVRSERIGCPPKPVAHIPMTPIESYIRQRMPSVRDNVARISVWILYWPFSLIVSLFEDLLKRIVDEIVYRLRRVYEGITNWIVKDAAKGTR
jgi:hypothetical protein